MKLYEKLGFERTRQLALLQFDGRLGNVDARANISFRTIDEPDWPLLRSFWDAPPSWQNTVEAVERSYKTKHILGAFDGDDCIGYIVFSDRFGRVSQFAVASNYRGAGIGKGLVRAMQERISEGFSMQVINIDKSNQSAIGFFESLGFYERLAQWEMLMPFNA